MPDQQRNKKKNRKRLVDKSNCRKSSRKKSADRHLSKDELISFVGSVLVGILSDAFQQLPRYSTTDYRADVSTVKRRLKAEGLSFATTVLPRLSQGLFDDLEGRPASYPSFKLWDGRYPVFMKELFQNALGLVKHINHLDHDERQPYVRFIYQLSVCFKKLKGPYKRSELAEQYANFVEVDRQLGDIDFSTEELQPILKRAKYLCSKFMEGFTLEATIPRPGPGATNKSRKSYERYEPHVLFRQIDDVFDYTEWFFVRPEDAFPISAPSIVGNLPVVDEPTSRFKFVPKTWAKARGICIEEFEVQWLQQALRRALTKHLSRNKFYDKRIKLNDQSVNAWLALASSKDRTMATLDMSDASDRVARELVSLIFECDPTFVDQLMALSTKWVEPPPESKSRALLKTNKFAPMGSALCFPVMSLVHMFLLRAMIQLYAPQYPHLSSANVFVYGDDIVLPSSCAHLAYEWLPKFGMKFNETKSFVHSYFRESCGTHAYYGRDITPIFVRESPKHWSGSAINSLLETEYQFHERFLPCSARAVRSSLLALSKSVDRYVPVSSNVLGFKRRHGDPTIPLEKVFPPYSTKIKYVRDYQTFHRLEWVLEAKVSDVGFSSDIHRYMRWHAEKPESRMISDTSDELFIRKRWVPMSACALHT